MNTVFSYLIIITAHHYVFTTRDLWYHYNHDVCPTVLYCPVNLEYLIWLCHSDTLSYRHNPCTYILYVMSTHTGCTVQPCCPFDGCPQNQFSMGNSQQTVTSGHLEFFSGRRLRSDNNHTLDCRMKRYCR